MIPKKLIFSFIPLFFLNSYLFADTGSVVQANMLSNLLSKHNYLTASKILKENPLLLYTPNEEGFEPLPFAVYKNDLELIKWLIQENVALNSDEYQLQPLQIALIYSKVEAFSILLSLGADPNIMVNYSPLRTTRTAIKLSFLTLFLNKNNFLNILLENGVDPDLIGSKGFSLLGIASQLENWEAVKILKKFKANPNIINNKGKTPFLLLLEKGDKNDVLEFLNIFTEQKPSILNFQTRAIKAPLFFCVENHRLKEAEILLDEKAFVDIEDVRKRTPLYYSIAYKDKEMTELLMKYSPNLNHRGISHKALKKLLD